MDEKPEKCEGCGKPFEPTSIVFRWQLSCVPDSKPMQTCSSCVDNRMYTFPHSADYKAMWADAMERKYRHSHDPTAIVEAEDDFPHTDVLWKCPECGNRFWGNGDALHNRGCSRRGYDGLTIITGPNCGSNAVPYGWMLTWRRIMSERYGKTFTD